MQFIKIKKLFQNNILQKSKINKKKKKKFKKKKFMKKLNDMFKFVKLNKIHLI